MPFHVIQRAVQNQLCPLTLLPKFEYSPCKKNCHAEDNIYLVSWLSLIRPAKDVSERSTNLWSYKNQNLLNFDNKLWNCLTASWLIIATGYIKNLQKPQCITWVNKRVSASVYTYFCACVTIMLYIFWSVLWESWK